MENLEEIKPVGQNWKQPIDPSLRYSCGEDYVAAVLFILLLLGTTNDRSVVKIGKYIVELHRGQVLYGRFAYAKYFGTTSPSTIDRALKRLATMHNKVNIQRTRHYTVVTIRNYDELISMNKYLNNQRTPVDQPMNTNKNGNSEEIDKNKFLFKTNKDYKKGVINV